MVFNKALTLIVISSLIMSPLWAHELRKTEMLWEIGLSYISLGQTKEAKKTFLEILENYPTFYPSEEVSPKIMQAFLSARQAFIKSNKLQHIYGPSVSIERVSDYQIKFAISLKSLQSSDISFVTLFFRSLNQSFFRSYLLEKNTLNHDSYTITINIKDKENIFHYYVEFLNNQGRSFLELGSEKNPFSIYPAVKEKITMSKVPTVEGLWPRLKEGLPLFISASIALALAMSFGLMKVRA